MATRFFPRYKANLITSRFGTRIHPVTGIKKTHNGIDLTATNDGKVGNKDYILAHTGGTVEAVGYDISAGNYVKIRVDSRTLMVYYHLRDKSTLKKGAKVNKGDQLGYMGKTGTATGPHLHFGIQFDGKWIDPEPYLDKDWQHPRTYVNASLPILERGCKGDDVKGLQTLLNFRFANHKDWVVLDTDGSFGPASQKAVKLVQGFFGITENGICNAETWAELQNNTGFEATQSVKQEAVPAVQEPSGTAMITSNGVHDVKNFASAQVNVDTPPTISETCMVTVSCPGTFTLGGGLCYTTLDTNGKFVTDDSPMPLTSSSTAGGVFKCACGTVVVVHAGSRFASASAPETEGSITVVYDDHCYENRTVIFRIDGNGTINYK